MQKEEILVRLTDLLVQQFEIARDQIRPEAHLFDELDLDSIDAIDLVVSLEEQTGFSVSEDELRAVRIVQDVVDLIYRKVGSE